MVSMTSTPARAPITASLISRVTVIYRSTTGESNNAQLVAQFDLKDGIVLETGIKNEDN